MIKWCFRVVWISIISSLSYGMAFTFSIRSARLAAAGCANKHAKTCNLFRQCLASHPYKSSITNGSRSMYYMSQSRSIRNRSALLSKLDASEEQFSISLRPSYTKCAYTTTTSASRSISIPEDEVILMKMHQTLEGEIIPASMELFNDRPSSCLGDVLPDKVVAILGVSGGCDSVGLFHGLMALFASTEIRISYQNRSRKVNVEIHVAHFDHKKRGDESDGDRILVESLCKEYGIPFHCYYWGDESMILNNEEEPTFSQEVARNWRRNTLSELLSSCCSGVDEVCPGFILTAHHADDNDETILMKFIRGAHISSLTGMGATSIFTHDEKGDKQSAILFGRPMISIRKEDIQNFLMKYFEGTDGNPLPWREDSSNISDEYLRNRVRNELIPLLSELSGGEAALRKRLQNLETQSRKVKDDIRSRLGERYGGLSTGIQTKNDPGLFRLSAKLNAEDKLLPLDLTDEEAIHRWITSRMYDSGGGSISYDQLQRIYQQINMYPRNKEWTLDIGSGWRVSRVGNMLECSSQNETATLIDLRGEWRIINDDIASKQIKEEKETLRIFTGDKLSGYRSSDFAIKAVEGHEQMTFTPSWRHGRSPTKVKEFLRGQKVPLHLRGIAPILCCDCEDLERIVAVYVVEDGSRGKWMIDADFEARNDDSEGTHCLFIVKKK